MRNYIIIISLFLQFIAPSLKAQTYKYDILIKNNKIGVLTANLQATDSTKQVNIEVDCKLNFVLEEDIKFIINSIYINNTLSYSSSSIYRNNKIEFTSIIRKANSYYTISRNKHELRFLGDIKYSGSILYFEEPENRTIIFSEIDNIYKPIKKIGNHTYSITNPKTNKTSIFTYKNGILEQAKIIHTYIDLTLNRII